MDAVIFRSPQDFHAFWASPEFSSQRARETELTRTHAGEATYDLEAFCAACNASRTLFVDYEHSGGPHGDQPNWRETLRCPVCDLNNRQRAASAFLRRSMSEHPQQSVYLTEQVTPFYGWTHRMFGPSIVGSEYLGRDREGGSEENAIRHEDLQALSFPSGSFDLVMSCDVLEHVPDYSQALREMARVLRPGGRLFLQTPIGLDRAASIQRARMKGSTIVHLLPAVYHGNPLPPHTSLNFVDFGWDLLETILASGFSNASVHLLWNEEHGHLGQCVWIEAVR